MIIDIFENTRKTESNVKKSKPENRDYRIKKDEHPTMDARFLCR